VHIHNALLISYSCRLHGQFVIRIKKLIIRWLRLRIKTLYGSTIDGQKMPFP